MGKLAVNGGSPVISAHDAALFHWPIVNDEMRRAQADVLESGNMSGTDIAARFEAEFAKWQGRKFALSHNNGTSALTAAMYGLGVSAGDEVICTSLTYWASCLGALQLGASVVFCDIDAETLQMSPESFEERITPRTKLVVVVHYMSCPCDIGETMARAIRMAEHTFRKADDFRLEGRVVDVPVALRAKCPRQDIDGYLANVFKENSGKNFDVERVIRGTYEAEFAATYPEDRFPLPLRLLRLGSKVLVGMPFEVLTEIGLRLKRACPNAELISITGGYEGYLPLAKEYRRGGYEATLGPRFHRRAGDDFLAAAIAAVNAFETGPAKV